MKRFYKCLIGEVNLLLRCADGIHKNIYLSIVSRNVSIESAFLSIVVRMLSRFSLIFLIMVFMLFSCEEYGNKDDVRVVSILGTEAFDEAQHVVYSLDDRFTLDLWAPGPLLANAVAISFDNQGHAYVAETNRRKSSDIDIREHADWMLEDLAMTSLEDTKAFHQRKLAPDLSDENDWMEDFNEDGSHDYQDLMVQSEIIRMIYDTDGDGRADASHQYAGGMDDMLTGVAAGVLHHNDRVYVTAAPDLIGFEDRDDDGRSDQRKVLSHGYGLHIAFAGHDMSGLTMGHDGKLYWSIGDMGLNVTDQDGRKWQYPHEGAVMRCYPDGSEFEVFAHGLRNPQELAFDAYGNLFTVDNDGDHAGENERYVHIIEGSDSGWRINWQYGKYDQPHEEYKVWMDEHLSIPYHEGQAAYITPPIALAANGPAGLAYQPGTALHENWNQQFFVTYFTGNQKYSKLSTFQLKAKNSSFQVINEQDILTGINGTGIAFGPDGALYINDWKDSYDKKDQGRIWKLDSVVKNTARSQTQQLLQAGAAQLHRKELSLLLKHADMRVRQMAQFQLVKNKDSEALLAHALQGSDLFGRLHAIWGYGQLLVDDESLLADMLALSRSDDINIKAQIAKVMGDAAHRSAYPILVELLKDSSAYVRRHSVEALGKLGNSSAFDLLIKQLEDIAISRDPHMRHTIALALSRLDEGLRLRSLHSHPSVEVRLGAVVALRALGSAHVSAFLHDSSELVVAEAARAINDDASIPEAISDLAALLEISKHQSQVIIRRSINANLRQADSLSAARLSQYAKDKKIDLALRKDALWALGYWPDPPVLDRVDNQHRILKKGDLGVAQAAFSTVYAGYASEHDPAMKSMILRVAGKLLYRDASLDLVKIINNKTASTVERSAALQSLSALDYPHLAQAVRTAMADSSKSIRIIGLDILAQSEISAAEKIDIIVEVIANASYQEKQAVIQTLSQIRSTKSEALLMDLMSTLKDQVPEIQLDILRAAKSYGSTDLEDLIQVHEDSINKNDKLSLYAASLYGGDEARGQQIFAYNQSAQCLRCHQVAGYGNEVGPVLDGVGSLLSREELLLALVAPNDRIAPGYGSTSLTLKDQSTYVGVIISEDNKQITLRDAAKIEHIISKDVISLREDLPSGMFSQEKILTPYQIRDLVAFLAGLSSKTTK